MPTVRFAAVPAAMRTVKPARTPALALFASLGLLLASAAQPSPAAGSVGPGPAVATLTGQVVDLAGDPVPGAKVKLFADGTGGRRGALIGRTTTGADGAYQIEATGGGCYHVSIAAPAPLGFGGKARWRAKRCVAAGQSVDLGQAVASQPGATLIGGRVTDTDGRPVESVRAVLFALNADGSRGRFLDRTFSDGNGDYRFSVTDGCYQVKLIAPDGARFGNRLSLTRSSCVVDGSGRSDLDATLRWLSPYLSCRYRDGGSIRTEDFAGEVAGGKPVTEYNLGWLNGERTFVRSVFSLGPDEMFAAPGGLGLAVDVGIDQPLDFTYRAELRETLIDQPIPAGSTQAYCMRFRVDELPDLYGPVTVFQRFNRDIDGPDIELELTGANQFSNATPNELQVVAWDGRHRITGVQLAEYNTVLVAVHNDGVQGAYKVVLNGTTIRQGSGLDTVGSPDGGWSQFGIYPHGLHDDSGTNRQDQIDSGFTRIAIDYADFTLVDYSTGSPDLSEFTVGP
jgi:protocatechuate 3,4-dioxygenase beta subunit